MVLQGADFNAVVVIGMVSLLLFRLPIAILCPFIDQSTLVIDSLYKFIQLNRYLVVDHSLWSCTFQSMGNNILSFKSHYYFVALLAKRKSHIIHLKKTELFSFFQYKVRWSLTATNLFKSHYYFVALFCWLAIHWNLKNTTIFLLFALQS